jgi:hypothetical protein
VCRNRLLIVDTTTLRVLTVVIATHSSQRVFRTYGFVCAFYASGGAWLHAPAHTALAAAAAPVTPAPVAALLLPQQQPALHRQHTSSSSTGSTSSVSLQQPSFKRKASTHKLPIATPPDIDTSVGTANSTTNNTTTTATGTAVTTQYPTEETAPAAAAAVSEVAVTTETNRFVVNGGWVVFGGSSPGYAQFSALVRSLVDRVEVRSASYSSFLRAFMHVISAVLKCS